MTDSDVPDAESSVEVAMVCCLKMQAAVAARTSDTNVFEPSVMEPLQVRSPPCHASAAAELLPC